MSLQSELYSRLSGYAGLMALVSARIYPQMIPDKEPLPAVTYSIVSNIPEHAMGQDPTIQTYRVQVSCWAEDFDKSKEIEVQVKAALSRYRAGNIKDCLFDSSIDLYDGDETIYHVPVDFIIFYDTTGDAIPLIIV